VGDVADGDDAYHNGALFLAAPVHLRTPRRVDEKLDPLPLAGRHEPKLQVIDRPVRGFPLILALPSAEAHLRAAIPGTATFLTEDVKMLYIRYRWRPLVIWLWG